MEGARCRFGAGRGLEFVFCGVHLREVSGLCTVRVKVGIYSRKLDVTRIKPIVVGKGDRIKGGYHVRIDIGVKTGKKRPPVVKGRICVSSNTGFFKGVEITSKYHVDTGTMIYGGYRRRGDALMKIPMGVVKLRMQ